MANFSFVGVENGWFKALFYTSDTSVLLWSTNIGGIDTGKLLINALCYVCQKDQEKETIIFNGENKVHLVTFQKIDKKIKITVSKLTDMPFGYIGVQHTISNDKAKTILFEITCPIKQFAQNVHFEFSKYHNSDYLKQYESNWFSFPEAELETLKNTIKAL